MKLIKQFKKNKLVKTLEIPEIAGTIEIYEIVDKPYYEIILTIGKDSASAYYSKKLKEHELIEAVKRDYIA